MAQWAIARRAAHAVHTFLESVGDRPALQLARAYGTDSLIVAELWVRLGGSTPEQVLVDLRQISSPEKKTWQPQFLETSEIRSRKRFPRMTIRCGEMAVPKWQNIHRNDVGPPMFPLHGKKHKKHEEFGAYLAQLCQVTEHLRVAVFCREETHVATCAAQLQTCTEYIHSLPLKNWSAALPAKTTVSPWSDYYRLSPPPASLARRTQALPLRKTACLPPT